MIIWNMAEEPGRFIICYPGQRIQNRFDHSDWVDLFSNGDNGPYLYDTVKKVIFPFPKNALYEVVQIEPNEAKR